jgi:hypothetical protein
MIMASTRTSEDSAAARLKSVCSEFEPLPVLHNPSFLLLSCRTSTQPQNSHVPQSSKSFQDRKSVSDSYV